MPDDSTKSRKRLLEPMERISEILFGLIMVLTFTCSFSVVGATRLEVRKMLVAALGCNLAWGIIDAVFYLMSCLSEQGQGIVALRALRKTVDPTEGATHHRRCVTAGSGIGPAGGGIRGDARETESTAGTVRAPLGLPRTISSLPAAYSCWSSCPPFRWRFPLSSFAMPGWPCVSRTQSPSLCCLWPDIGLATTADFVPEG